MLVYVLGEMIEQLAIREVQIFEHYAIRFVQCYQNIFLSIAQPVS